MRFGVVLAVDDPLQHFEFRLHVREVARGGSVDCRQKRVALRVHDCEEPVDRKERLRDWQPQLLGLTEARPTVMAKQVRLYPLPLADQICRFPIEQPPPPT